MKSEYQKKRENVTLSRVALRYYRDSVTVILTARHVTCSDGTDCHAESPSGRVQCFKMAKIDQVPSFYPTLWLEKEIFYNGKTYKKYTKTSL